MKVRTTQKTIRELKPICFGYCEIQELLHFEDPIFYTAGQLGRKADTYNIDGIWIETGYSTTGDINEIPYKTTQEYEKKAKEQRKENLTREQRKEKNRKLLKEMIVKGNIYRSYIKESITYKELENFLEKKLNKTIKREE